MSGTDSLLSLDKTVALVQEIHEVTSRLVSAMSEKEGLSNYRVDSAITERAKIVHGIREKCSISAREFNTENNKLETAKRQLIEANLANEKIENEIRELENSMKCESCVDESVVKKTQESRLCLKLYKTMTGVHFDINGPENELTGFIGVKGNSNHHSALVPFMLKKNESGISELLWSKFSDALRRDSATEKS